MRTFPSESKKHVILDTDMGVDDAHCCAALLMSQRSQLHAITTVFGNIPLSQVRIT